MKTEAFVSKQIFITILKWRNSSLQRRLVYCISKAWRVWFERRREKKKLFAGPYSRKLWPQSRSWKCGRRPQAKFISRNILQKRKPHVGKFSSRFPFVLVVLKKRFSQTWTLREKIRRDNYAVLSNSAFLSFAQFLSGLKFDNNEIEETSCLLIGKKIVQWNMFCQEISIYFSVLLKRDVLVLKRSYN